jgi:tRNA modification GTPase
LNGPTTIFALSTPRGRGAIGIVRLSGPAAGETLRAFAGALPPAREARLALLRDPATGEALDRALCLWFPGPRSYTGEDVAELHIHGGPAVVAGILNALATRPGLVPAEPGAFTRRAFDNGRLDLTAAEGIADLIEAETAVQRKLALKAVDGELARLVEAWRATLLRAMALLEAEIDFPDEGLDNDMLDRAHTSLLALKDAIAAHLTAGPRGERLRHGFRVVLLGLPNVGKSSLLNALAKRDVAIVTDLPGTTRDVLEIHLDLGGYPVTLADMAGLRATAEPIEAIGVARAEAHARAADLRLLLLEATDAPPPMPQSLAALRQLSDLLLLTKADTLTQRPADARGALYISSRTGEGLPALLAAIEAQAIDQLGAADAPLFSRLRHRQALSECRMAVSRALEIWAEAPPELLAEDLRLAAHALGRITGRIDVEELLDTIFGEFCIGK